MTLKLEGVEIPHSTACLLNIRLHFTCYHFTSKNFLKILRFESCLHEQYHFSFIIFPRSLWDFHSFSMNKSSTCKKKGATFWVYCFSVLNRWKCCRYLGISNKVVMLFRCCFYKGQLAMAICLSLKKIQLCFK